MVKGLANEHGARIAVASADRPFADLDDVWRRCAVPVSALEKLADADAFQVLGLDRRQALWRLRGLGLAPLPLFAAAEARDNEPAVQLKAMTEGREVVEDYRSVQLSLRDHPVAFLRPELDRRGIVPAGRLGLVKDGARIQVAGIVLIRQRPGKGNVTFITLEDESGIANIIVWQRLHEQFRRVILSAAMIAVKGRFQREGQVTHLIADQVEDLTPLLGQVGNLDFPHRTGPGDGARNGSPDPRHPRPPAIRPAAVLPPGRDGGMRLKSRDFH
jgi:error-prone DNA polymerase